MIVKFRRVVMIAALSASLTALVGITGHRAAAQAPIVLRGITPWTADYNSSKAFFIFQELVNKNEKLKGKVNVSYLGGPEVADPNNQFSALKNGVVDVILGAAAYYRTELPLAAAVQFTKKLPTELRQSGYFDLMRRIHADAGVIYLSNTSGGDGFRIYLKRPIDKPDFKGLRLRVSPVYVPLVQALGGTPVAMAPAEIYTGLERGVIDGFGWTRSGIDLYGWHELGITVINHPFYSLDNVILINKGIWDRLPNELKAALEEVGAELEGKVQEFLKARLEKEDERLAKLGVKFITFSEADAKKYVGTAYSAGWEDFLAKNKASFAAQADLPKQLQNLGNY
jgi:TRAP-type C4-dicarboxylate transport system substrate-binding protein